jgi:hypothetical protein
MVAVSERYWWCIPNTTLDAAGTTGNPPSIFGKPADLPFSYSPFYVLPLSPPKRGDFFVSVLHYSHCEKIC